MLQLRGRTHPNATLETGFSCTPLDPLLVNGNGLTCAEFSLITDPLLYGWQLYSQYALKPSLSIQAGYVTTLAHHLEVFPGSNNVSQILPAGENADDFKPFKDFTRGSSYAATEGNSSYHGLQVTVEKEFAGGLNFLGTYTWSKTLSDAQDLLSPGSTFPQGYRAPDARIRNPRDYGLASFDIRMSSTSAAVTNFLRQRQAPCSMPVGCGLAGGWSSERHRPMRPTDYRWLQFEHDRRNGCNALVTGKARHPDHTTWISSESSSVQPALCVGRHSQRIHPIIDQPLGCVL